jgi:hypothetical protein
MPLIIVYPGLKAGATNKRLLKAGLYPFPDLEIVLGYKPD